MLPTVEDRMAEILRAIREHGAICIDGWTGETTRQAVYRLELEGRATTEIHQHSQYTVIEVTAAEEAKERVG